ncbi:hypothetical protein AB0B15_03525 [Streptomyces sp. NPDC045456]
MTTNYADAGDHWDYSHDDELIEKPCPRCRGRWPQVDACVECEGDGTVLV